MKATYEVTFITPEGESRYHVAEDEYLLSAASRAGLDLPFTCLQGWCITCAIAAHNRLRSSDRSDLLTAPIMVLFMTPFIRPFRWRRLFWTYVLPLVPLTCVWDGVVSHLRAYSAEELEDFARELRVDHYMWKAGRIRIPSTPAHVTYLVGYPAPRPTREAVELADLVGDQVEFRASVAVRPPPQPGLAKR